MPLSGVLSEYGFAGGWPSIFYVFGAVGTIWCIAFLLMVYEDPESHPRIAEDEKKYILSALWGNAGVSVSIPRSWQTRDQFHALTDARPPLVFPVTASPVVLDSQVFAVLGHPDSAHGSKLRLRDVDDPAAHLYEANLTL